MRAAVAAWWLGGAVGQSSLVGGNVNGDGDGKRVKVMGKGHFLNTDLSYCSKTHIYSSKHTFTLQKHTFTIYKQPQVVAPRVPRQGITLIAPHLVVKDVDRYLLPFIAHYTDHLPDLSEGPEKGPQDEDLGYWLKYSSKKLKLARHRVLPGLSAVRLHVALDFAMAQGFQCVMFKRDDRVTDQTIPFILGTWVCYLAQMEGRPFPDTIAGQNILHYMLNRKASMATSWRKRQQAFSSA